MREVAAPNLVEQVPAQGPAVSGARVDPGPPIPGKTWHQVAFLLSQFCVALVAKCKTDSSQ